ncbi:hypothetical protein DAEQUDRAFT_727778 [Daedalea quercina L-15889]|uniref:Phosphatases II n=1 Tax=Daedalea quercina L-15889 TaxID=1314783 RepID=A0A165PNT8_9APHY|nr:hypothetical protein DAEQUDRAFT_727778 [Daedalea quercina L-15889]
MLDALAAHAGAAPTTPGPSLLAARASKGYNPMDSQAPPLSAFNLRLPAFVSAPGTTLPPQTAGAAQNIHPFPPVAGASSMPTLSASPGSFSASMGGMRPHRYSVPHGRPVAFNPFFDAIRQNLELAHGAEPSGEGGIALRLPRRVRRRVGDLPFEWLREIARRSGRAQESSSESESEAEERARNSKAGVKAKAPPRRHHHTSRHPPPPKPAAAAPSAGMRSTTPPLSPPSSPTRSHTQQQSPHHHLQHRPHSQTYPAPRETRPTPAVPVKPASLEDATADSADDDAQSTSSQSPPSADELTRALELQFYRIELGEQRRLMGVMEHHSMESQAGGVGGGAAGGVPGSVGGGAPGGAKVREEREEEDFPFSITAGLEKGSKNRYRHIWPFEHARVRLRKARPEDDDYMNASYVQPLGTTKRYIATQGPLAATFADFWTLCWEQNVHVIVMLTREIEGNTVKCGKYWAEGEYGPLRLKLLATDDTPERERRRRDKEMNGGFFSAHVPPAQKSKRRGKPQQGRQGEDDSDGEREIVRRVFKLTHAGYPQAKPRIITQLQYLDWPDFNVPDDPRGVLSLIREVEEAVARSREAGDRAWGEGPMHPGPWPSRLTISMPSPPKEHAHPAVPSTIVEDVPMDDNDIDPTTGVARHAVGNPPVLLHCSAGVGRTGGYIAVDAVLDGIRREIRKRQEQASPSPERMDIDPSPSPPSSGDRAGSRSRAPSGSPPVPELTVPVAVGADEVHVRVAGFTEVMDVDSEVKRDDTVGKGKTPRKEIPRTVVPASPELVNEVRRATMLRWPSGSATSTGTDAPPVSGKDWESSSSDSSQIASRSATRSTTLSGESTAAQSRSDQSTQSLSPPSSHTSSSTNLSAAVAKQTAQVSLAQKARKEPSPSSSSGDAENKHQTRQDPDAEAHASRLDTWRSEVRLSSPPIRDPASKSPDSAAAAGAQTDEEGTVLGEGSHYEHPRVFDYAQPRRLHQDISPPVLSTYDEPIRRVIEDMREQRMSLCQSLRQYVFVYRAVIEGTLMIVDEEKHKEQRRWRSPTASPGDRGPRSRADAAMDGLMHSPEVAHSAGPGPPGALRERGVLRKRSVSDYMREDGTIDGHHLTMSPGGTKRGASPTELPKEDVQGEAMLTKRPSIKRTARMDTV